MALSIFGAGATLHSLVQANHSLLTQAKVSCTTLRAALNKSDHVSTALVQLDQALLEAQDYVQREYDHISNTYGSAVASKGDQTVCLYFGIICGRVDERITKPLERLVQHLQYHQTHHHDHSHIHHHCYFCTSYYYHHHHSHRTHWPTGSILLGASPHVHYGHHHNRHHQHLTEYESRFQEMINEWSSIKSAVASCFDDLETRLKDKKPPSDGGGGGNPPSGGGKSSKSGSDDNKGKSFVAEAAEKMIAATNLVDDEMRQISNVEDKIFSMGARAPRGGARYTSSSRSSSSSSISIRL